MKLESVVFFPSCKSVIRPLTFDFSVYCLIIFLLSFMSSHVRTDWFFNVVWPGNLECMFDIKGHPWVIRKWNDLIFCAYPITHLIERLIYRYFESVTNCTHFGWLWVYTVVSNPPPMVYYRICVNDLLSTNTEWFLEKKNLLTNLIAYKVPPYTSYLLQI